MDFLESCWSFWDQCRGLRFLSLVSEVDVDVSSSFGAVLFGSSSRATAAFGRQTRWRLFPVARNTGIEGAQALETSAI